MHDPLSNQCGSSRAAVLKPRPSGGYHEAIQPTCRGECIFCADAISSAHIASWVAAFANDASG